MKTASEIQGDIYRFIRNDIALCSMISGDVYRNGYRPRDSRLEDIVITFTSGNVADIETGVVTINIYVPDIDPYQNGVFVQDGQRTAELENAAARWVKSLTADKSNYLFRLRNTIYTEQEPDTKQHFVVVALQYSYCGDE